VHHEGDSAAPSGHVVPRQHVSHGSYARDETEILWDGLDRTESADEQPAIHVALNLIVCGSMTYKQLQPAVSATTDGVALSTVAPIARSSTVTISLYGHATA
jgi:hypothetical protein